MKVVDMIKKGLKNQSGQVALLIILVVAVAGAVAVSVADRAVVGLKTQQLDREGMVALKGAEAAIESVLSGGSLTGNDLTYGTSYQAERLAEGTDGFVTADLIQPGDAIQVNLDGATAESVGLCWSNGDDRAAVKLSKYASAAPTPTPTLTPTPTDLVGPTGPAPTGIPYISCSDSIPCPEGYYCGSAPCDPPGSSCAQALHCISNIAPRPTDFVVGPTPTLIYFPPDIRIPGCDYSPLRGATPAPGCDYFWIVGDQVYFSSSDVANQSSVAPGPVNYYAYDGVSGRSAGFTVPASANFSCPEGFSDKVEVPMDTGSLNSKILRVLVLYQPTKIAVVPIGGSLPEQQIKITALGKYETTNVQRKVELVRENEKVPSIFDNVLFTKGNISP